MINRVLIRLKIVQVIYAYCLNGGKTINNVEKELFFSLQKAYDLYQYLLLLIPEITHYAYRRQELARKKHLATAAERNPNTKFVDNLFAAQVRENVQLQQFQQVQKKSWDNEPEMIRILFDRILESAYYKEYMESANRSYDEDRELWRKIYKNILSYNDDLDDCLEGMSLYWNDDKEVVDTFVLKTIKRFDIANGPQQELLPMFSDSETEEFARTLFRSILLHRDEYTQIIEQYAEQWDAERVSYIDLVIIQAALAELLNFPAIPVNVTLNEFVELAKRYSSPKSASFVNGVLDILVRRLKEENKLLKN